MRFPNFRPLARLRGAIRAQLSTKLDAIILPLVALPHLVAGIAAAVWIADNEQGLQFNFQRELLEAAESELARPIESSLTIVNAIAHMDEIADYVSESDATKRGAQFQEPLVDALRAQIVASPTLIALRVVGADGSDLVGVAVRPYRAQGPIGRLPLPDKRGDIRAAVVRLLSGEPALVTAIPLTAVRDDDVSVVRSDIPDAYLWAATSLTALAEQFSDANPDRTARYLLADISGVVVAGDADLSSKVGNISEFMADLARSEDNLAHTSISVDGFPHSLHAHALPIGLVLIGAYPEVAWSFMRSIYGALVVAFTLAAIAVTGIALRMSVRRVVVKPLTSLRRAFRRLGMGDFDIRLNLGRSDEIGDLAFSFNEMAGRLAAARDEATAHKAELARARDEAQAGSRAKSSFLAAMSHEIRTPMNGVIGMLDLALDADVPPSQGELLRQARRSATVLLGILNDILDAARIETGRLKLESIPLDPRSTARDVIALAGATASDKGIALHCEVAPTVPAAVLGDPLRLGQVLTNLVSNAVKFTNRGSVALSVEALAASSGHARLRYSVRDTGIGIAPEFLSRIFAVFSQADQTISRRFGGSGLGLSISRDLVRLMGGELEVTSTQGQGSTFAFTVDFATTEQAPADVQSESGSGASTRIDLAGARILIAEDNPVNQMVARQMIERLGGKAEIAADGAVAVEKSAREEFALLLMDCQMPVLDGFAATERIRAREAGSGRRLPIIALTANAVAGDRERCIASGMDDYLSKPVRLDELSKVLANWLRPAAARPAASAAPVAADPAPTALLDASALDALRALAAPGDDGALKALLATFVESAEELARAIAEGVAAKDLAAAKRAAHSLKSSSASMGALPLSRACATMEKLCGQGELTPEVQKLVEEIAALHKSSVEALRAAC